MHLVPDSQAATADLVTDILASARRASVHLRRGSGQVWPMTDADLCALVGLLAADPAVTATLAVTRPAHPTFCDSYSPSSPHSR